MQSIDITIEVPSNLTSILRSASAITSPNDLNPTKSQEMFRICCWNINKLVKNAFATTPISQITATSPASQSVTKNQVDSVECSSEVVLPDELMQKSSDNTPDDAVLIKAYVEKKDQRAFETLLNRYEEKIFKRIRKLVWRSVPNTDPSALEELSQNIWIKAINNLERYEDDGRFLNWMYTITSNEVIDYFRQINVRPKTQDITFPSDDEDDEYIDPYYRAEDGTRVDENAMLEEEISHLETVLIPGMKVEQRLVYLLRFESMLWDQRQPLTWDQLARLNGLTESQAWTNFESARKQLMSGIDQKNIDREELLVFLIWTQANRPDKSKTYTHAYFAELLGESANTLKTRYRSAEKYLQKGIEQFRQSGYNPEPNS